MIYYKIDQGLGYIFKYNVSYDNETLEKIKNRLITDCSKRTHVIRESTLKPSALINNPLGEKISHLKRKNTGKTTSYSDTSEDKTIYEYNYILITYPYLAFLVGKLLSGDETAIYDIVDYEIEYPTNYDELLAQEVEEINKLVDNNPEEVIKKAENLKRLLEEKELNKYNVSTKCCYTKLIHAIKFEQIDKMPISSIIAYKNFFTTEKGTLDFDTESKKLIRLKK